jgi:hypothetical protein
MGIDSSSLLDLASQAPSAIATLFLTQDTSAESRTNVNHGLPPVAGECRRYAAFMCKVAPDTIMAIDLPVKQSRRLQLLSGGVISE